MVEDCTNFLKRIEKLKPYKVEFYDNGIMKPKVYSSDFEMRGEN